MALLIHHDAVHAATPYYGPAPTPDYGGTAPGAHRPSHFLGSRTVRDTWIALWVMWLLWALLFLTRHLLGPPLAVEAEGAERVVTASSQVVPEDGPYDITRDGGGGLPGESVPVASPALRPAPRPKNFFGRAVDNIKERVSRTHGLVRDLTLMLLLVVTLNSFGLASRVFVLIASWTYVFFAFVWAGMMILLDNRIIDLILGSIEMLLLLAMLIAAYALGWHVV